MTDKDWEITAVLGKIHPMMKKVSLVLITILVWAAGAAAAPAAEKRVPTVDDLLTLRSAGGTRISPDGKWVAYTVTETDFEQDAYVTHLWLAETATGRTFQLTR
ncbi:MAG: hypothetical protein ABSA30_12965, partial [Candidatus Aminicenantales bacterium]